MSKAGCRPRNWAEAVDYGVDAGDRNHITAGNVHQLLSSE